MTTTASVIPREIPEVRHPRHDVAERPFIIIWEVTRACDLACRHCRADAIPHRNPLELTTPEARALIDEIAGFGKPSPIFVLTGGDPMKRNDIAKLVEYGTSKGVHMALSPSATPLVTRERLVELHDLGLKAISLSIDGSTPEIHDHFRGFSGVFDRTIKLWEIAREIGLRVQINTTVTRHNVEDLAAVAQHLRGHSAALWSVFFLVPVGRGSVLEPITAQESEDVMNFLYDVGTVLPVKTTEGHHFKRIVLRRGELARRRGPDTLPEAGPLYHRLRAALGEWTPGPRERRSPMDVNAGRGFVFISHKGEICPSGFMPMSAGNVRTDSLRKVYQESDLFVGLRDPSRLKGRCGRCEFAAVCGGSRSRAYAVTGDPYAEDPLCAYEPPQ